jgi:hypothetical protein
MTLTFQKIWLRLSQCLTFHLPSDVALIFLRRNSAHFSPTFLGQGNGEDPLRLVFLGA